MRCFYRSKVRVSTNTWTHVCLHAEARSLRTSRSPTIGEPQGRAAATAPRRSVAMSTTLDPQRVSGVFGGRSVSYSNSLLRAECNE